MFQYVVGFHGATALHVPSHWIVHVFVAPQLFAADVHSVHRFTGSTGATALHVPSHWIVHVFVPPQLFGAELHSAP